MVFLSTYHLHQIIAKGTVTIETCSPLTTFDTTLLVYDSSGVVVACNDDACATQSRVQFASDVGQAFTIRLAGFRGATGSGLLTTSCAPIQCPRWPNPSVCPLTYNSSCTFIDFYFNNILSCYGSQGCSCGANPDNPACFEPPVVPSPPCPLSSGKCLKFNFQFGNLLSAADPRP